MAICGDKTHNDGVLTDKQGKSIRHVFQRVHCWVLIWERFRKFATRNKYWIDRGVSGWKGGFEQ